MQRSIDDDLDDAPEIWDELPDAVQEELDSDTPLPEPSQEASSVQKLTSLLQWFVLFTLLWQANNKISDNGLEWLLRFLFQFLHAVGVTCNCQLLIQFSSMFPTSLFLLRKLVGLDRDCFTKYVVCPTCCALYAPDDCTVRVGGRIVEKTCSHKQFRNSKECGERLAQKVILSDGSEKFYPFKTYCYNSIVNQTELLLKRPGFPDKCEQWRQREQLDGIYTDVYDGKVWQDFLEYKGKRFLKDHQSLAFAVNVDWFQPFTRRTDVSVGVIYLALLNLPREERFKWENIIVAGIVPDMEKMPKSLNPFLEPLVDEFQAFWNPGIRLHTSKSVLPLKYRAAILCAAADLPAVRKLCGLKGHTASRGCSKCFKLFPGSVKRGFDRSGFDRTNWPPRSNNTQRIYAEKVRKARNAAQYDKLSTKYGTYYTVLLKLEYFDVVRFTSIDPMHNLFQGTAKSMFKLWLAKGLLTKKKLKEIEMSIGKLDMGTGFGRLPKRIASNYGGYTASQWKNWTTVYSLYALKGVLPERHLQCWHTFVLACRYLSTPLISDTDLKKADLLFLKFAREFESLYKKKAVTINIHLHCHLKECVDDYGPVYSFWCFAFERFNGILGSTITNNRTIEVQLMRKLVSSRFVWNVGLPEEFRENFALFFNNYQETTVDKQLTSNCSPKLLNIATAKHLAGTVWSDLGQVVVPKAYKLLHFDRDDLQLLVQTYSVMYPGVDVHITDLGESCRRFGSVTLSGEKFGSKAACRLLRSSRVMALWAGNNGEVETAGALRPGLVKFYFLHSILLEGKYEQHIFACVQWLATNEDRELFRRPVEVWEQKVFEPAGPSTFIPIQRVYCKFACANVGHQKAVISPILRTFC